MWLGIIISAWMGWTSRPLIWIIYLLVMLTPMTVVSMVTTNNWRSEAGLLSQNLGEGIIVLFVSLTISGASFLVVYGLSWSIKRKLLGRAKSTSSIGDSANSAKFSYEKTLLSPEDHFEGDLDAIIRSLVPKWRSFSSNMPFQECVPLCQRIEMFATPAIAGVLQHYSSTKAIPPRMLRMVVYTAVLESGTHHTDEVNLAIAQLEATYAGN